jgi:hypothetical protein
MVRTSIFFDFGGTLARVPSFIDRPWKVWVGISRELDLQRSDILVQQALEAVDRDLEGRIDQSDPSPASNSRAPFWNRKIPWSTYHASSSVR